MRDRDASGTGSIVPGACSLDQIFFEESTTFSRDYTVPLSRSSIAESYSAVLAKVLYVLW